VASEQYPEEFLEHIKAVTHKRAKTVVEHILKHGHITTEELREKYGYDHPPRAARDVREEGIPLETFYVKSAEGRKIAAYRFADPSQVRSGRLGGRRVFSKKFKQSLLDELGSRCNICLQPYESRYLQVDHRIPYEVAGDTPITNEQRPSEEYMLLCGSCNRAKSWSCEHCLNWLELKSPLICDTCYWVHPQDYKHIAMQPVRRLDVIWREDEVEDYEELSQRVQILNASMPDYVKAVIKEHLESIEGESSANDDSPNG